jgi:hypothetical protein
MTAPTTEHAAYIAKPSGRTSTTSALTRSTEQVAKIEAHSGTSATPAAHVAHLVGVLPVFSKLVVVISSSRIANYLVCLVDFFELLLGAFVVRIYVGMQLSGHPAVSRLDVFLGSALVDSEYVVVVLCHMSLYRFLMCAAAQSIPFPQFALIK